MDSTLLTIKNVENCLRTLSVSEQSKEPALYVLINIFFLKENVSPLSNTKLINVLEPNLRTVDLFTLGEIVPSAKVMPFLTTKKINMFV